MSCLWTLSGFLIEYISHPVINSFTTASAITIAEAQFKVCAHCTAPVTVYSFTLLGSLRSSGLTGVGTAGIGAVRFRLGRRNPRRLPWISETEIKSGFIINTNQVQFCRKAHRWISGKVYRLLSDRLKCLDARMDASVGFWKKIG